MRDGREMNKKGATESGEKSHPRANDYVSK